MSHERGEITSDSIEMQLDTVFKVEDNEESFQFLFDKFKEEFLQ